MSPSAATMLLTLALQHKLMGDGLSEASADEALEEAIARGWFERVGDGDELKITEAGIEAGRKELLGDGA